VWDTQRIQPENYTTDTTVQTPDGPVTFGETDWAAYQADRDAVLGKYSETVQLSALHVMDKWEDPGISAYREAADTRAAIEEIPRYKGMDNSNADKLDSMTKSIRDLHDIVRTKIGRPGSVAPLPKGVGQAISKYAIKLMAEQGFIKTQDDVKLATLALAMQNDSRIKEAIRNPQQLVALINNPDVLMFYPYLLSRVPVWLRGKLPPNLQPQFDVWNRYGNTTTGSAVPQQGAAA
jgi:hypothetical protein